MSRFTRLAAATAIILSPTLAHAQYEDQGVRAFLAADQNGDELLTAGEFRVFIRQMADAGAPMSRRIRNLGAYGIAFNRADADGNGFVSPAELRAAENANS